PAAALRLPGAVRGLDEARRQRRRSHARSRRLRARGDRPAALPLLGAQLRLRRCARAHRPPKERLHGGARLEQRLSAQARTGRGGASSATGARQRCAQSPARMPAAVSTSLALPTTDPTRKLCTAQAAVPARKKSRMRCVSFCNRPMVAETRPSAAKYGGRPVVVAKVTAPASARLSP